jgi:PelA/Pel-15E family pectate lyase
VDFLFVAEAHRSAAEHGFDSGIQCILKCQIKVNGKLTIWCAQHDETTLEPRWGRSFEPPALTSAESAGILRLLMSQDNPSPEIKRAVHAGARWFERSRINGVSQTYRNGDKVIVQDKAAPPLWPRFSEIGTNRPIFCGRDGVIKYDIASIEAERRSGYAWYGGWGSDVASRYSRWKERWDPERIPGSFGRVGRRISAHAIGAYRTIPGTRSKSESLLARLVSLWKCITAAIRASPLRRPC